MTRIRVHDDSDITRLTLDGASRRNALDGEYWESFAHTLDRLEAGKPRAIVLTGEGEAFCAGGDIARMRDSISAISRGAFEASERLRMDRITQLLVRWAALAAPKVAAVNGAAVGGGLALAASCDYVIASEDAFFDSGFARLALPGDTGATYYLPRAIGPRRATMWLLRARRVDAHEALAIGLADEVVAASELRERATTVASDLASAAPVAAAYVLNRQAEVAALRRALDYEKEATLAAKQSPPHIEAVQRFFARTNRT